MKRLFVIAYGALAYLAFLLPIGYLVGFLADAGVPKSVNRGAGPLGPSLVVDALLLLAFGLQHSVMARPWFKRRIQRWVPASLERSTYVLASGAVLGGVFWLWRPVPAVLWDVHGTPLELLAWAGFAGGWLLAVSATFALSHLHLFGLAQVSARVRGRPPEEPGLRRSVLYRLVRHPMTAGLLLAFWSTPRMTVGHLVFAAGMTLYSLRATVLEERDLLRLFHDAYRTYRREVPALVPGLVPGLAPGLARVLRPGRSRPRGGEPAPGRDGPVTAGLSLELGLLTAGTALVTGLLLHPLVVPAAEAGADPAAGRAMLDVPGQGIRTYRLHVPGALRPQEPGPAGGSPGDRGLRPLVLALHGTGGDGERLRRLLGGELERSAGARGWLVAYPEALDGVWNDCRRAVRSTARDAGVDDVAFLRALVARLAAEHGADPSRVSILGFSGGGHMALRVALEAPALPRAVAVFGASLPTEEASLCRPVDGAVPVLLVNGTRDLVNPFAGGDVISPTGVPLGPVRPSRATVSYFRGRSGAVEPADVRHVVVEGGGHSVPGHASRFPRMVGPVGREYQGVQEALRFFAAAVTPLPAAAPR